MVLAVLLAAHPAAAATTVPAAGQAPDSAAGGPTLEVWTMGPGLAVWERFGHNAIVVRDPATGTGTLYNWGMFSFRQENFYLNFARGRMRYWMASGDAGWVLQQYRAAGRTVWRQPLRLTPAEVEAAIARLRANDTDATRFYRYDYYRDNCSTRVRDAVDAAIGGALRPELDTVQTTRTYRSHTRQLVRPDLPLYLGLQLLLGPGTDRPITAWDEAFLPMELMRALDTATRPWADGTRVPLLAGPREVLYQGPLPTELPPATSALGPALVIGLLLGGLVLYGRRGGAALVPARLYAFVTGIAGLLLWAGWLLTDHEVMRGNGVVLLLSGLALPLAVQIDRGGRLARAAAGAVGFGVLLALGVVLIPGTQPMAEAVALFGPANLALAWVVRSRARVYP